MKIFILATLLATLATLQGEAENHAAAPGAATPLPGKAASPPTRAERRQEALADFRTILQQAAAAQIYVNKINMATGDVQECIFELPAEELLTLKSILSRTKLIPVSDEEPEMVMIDGDFLWLQFMDAQGKKLGSYSLLSDWTSETQMKKSHRAKQRPTIADPYWYLSDTDFEQLHRLPTITSAVEWYPWEPEADEPASADSPESPTT